MMLWKCCTQYASKLEKEQCLQYWKTSVSSPIPKKGKAKECSNYCTTVFISMLAKQCSKFTKGGFNSIWIKNFQMFKLDSEKAEEPEIKLPTSVGSSKKQEFHKNIYFCFIDYAKDFDGIDHDKLWKILRDGNSRSPDLPLEKSTCTSGSNS